MNCGVRCESSIGAASAFQADVSLGSGSRSSPRHPRCDEPHDCPALPSRAHAFPCHLFLTAMALPILFEYQEIITLTQQTF
jgi:hypothetical protein